jgi:hypothetical protein
LLCPTLEFNLNINQILAKMAIKSNGYEIKIKEIFPLVKLLISVQYLNY